MKLIIKIKDKDIFSKCCLRTAYESNARADGTGDEFVMTDDDYAIFKDYLILSCEEIWIKIARYGIEKSIEADGQISLVLDADKIDKNMYHTLSIYIESCIIDSILAKWYVHKRDDALIQKYYDAETVSMGKIKDVVLFRRESVRRPIYPIF